MRAREEESEEGKGKKVKGDEEGKMRPGYALIRKNE